MTELKSNIKLVRLSSGEELVGEVQDGNGMAGSITIKLPTMLIPTAESISLMPYLAYTEVLSEATPLAIKERDIMWIVDPVQAMKTEYLNIFYKEPESSIIVPDNKIIT